MTNKKISILHLILITIAILSPILFNYKIILIGIILLWIEYLFLGNCILTKKQFGKNDKDMPFWFYALQKIGIKTNKRKLKIFVRNILPIIILIIAIIYQKVLRIKPLII